jgi:processive 1,2-diacylglycerol beta-glucosyltransferase
VVFMPLLIPGQEEGNAEFLENSGAGVRCYDFDQLDRTARELVGDRARRERMSEAGRAHGQPEAAKIILDQLIAKKGPPAELPSPLLGKIGAGSR